MHSSIASASANSGPRIFSAVGPVVSGSSLPPTYATTNTYRTITAPAYTITCAAATNSARSSRNSAARQIRWHTSESTL